MVPSIIAFTTCYQLLRQLLHTFLSVAVLVRDFRKSIPPGIREAAFSGHICGSEWNPTFSYQSCSLGWQPPPHTATSAYAHRILGWYHRECVLSEHTVCVKIWEAAHVAEGKCLHRLVVYILGGVVRCKKKKRDKWHKLKTVPYAHILQML